VPNPHLPAPVTHCRAAPAQCTGISVPDELQIPPQRDSLLGSVADEPKHPCLFREGLLYETSLPEEDLELDHVEVRIAVRMDPSHQILLRKLYDEGTKPLETSCHLAGWAMILILYRETYRQLAFLRDPIRIRPQPPGAAVAGHR
jgi:hypothetical protein